MADKSLPTIRTDNPQVAAVGDLIYGTRASVAAGLLAEEVAHTGDKLDATVAPGINDDSSAGYIVGSLWIDVTGDASYQCVDASVGAAVWVSTSGGGGWSVDDDTDFNYGHGLNALASLTASSGLRNIGIGNNAGTAITTGDDNICIGDNAGAALTTTQDGIYIGSDAGKLAQADNICIGSQCGDALNAGDVNNILIGTLVGTNLTDADDNVIIGDSAAAGTQATTMHDSVVIGSAAGAEVGSRNVVLGAIAASSNFANGNIDDSIFIGYQCADLVDSTDYCLFIGTGIDPDSESDDDQIMIGMGASVPAINGYFGARSDLDYSGKQLAITGPSAFSSAATNQDGGDLVLKGGQKASGGGANGYVMIEDGVYGIMSVQANATGETTVDATPRKIAAWNTDGLSNGMTADSTTGNDLTADVAGTFLVSLCISFSGTNSKTFQIELYKNGVATGFAVDRKLGSGGDVGSCSLVGIVALAATDTLEAYQSTSDGATAMTVTEGQFSAHRISS